ncbi:hypothetical protein WJX84_001933, partial [Apatococcus fuscideae]
LAAMVELVGEPFFVLAQLQMRMRLRVLVETSANAAKGVATLFLLSLPARYQPEPALSLSFAQVLYGGIIFAGYAGASLPHLLRRAIQSRQSAARAAQKEGAAASPPGSLLDRKVLWLCASYTAQAGEKLMLQEGSRVVMVLCATTDSQGVYGLVTNLGSLVVRTLFQPLEEAAFLAFSQPYVPSSPASSPVTSPAHQESQAALPSTGNDTRDSTSSLEASAPRGMADDPAVKDSQDSSQDGMESPRSRTGHEQHRRQLLSVLMKVALLAGLTAVAFGPPYTYLLLRILYGRRWADGTEAPRALAAYCTYILFLAANGILEAFLHAVSTPRQIMASNAVLVAVSAVHLGLSVSLIRKMGVVGLIVADGVNMALRVLYCLWFVAHTTATIKQAVVHPKDFMEILNTRTPPPLDNRPPPGWGVNHGGGHVTFSGPSPSSSGQAAPADNRGYQPVPVQPFQLFGPAHIRNNPSQPPGNDYRPPNYTDSGAPSPYGPSAYPPMYTATAGSNHPSPVQGTPSWDAPGPQSTWGEASAEGGMAVGVPIASGPRQIAGLKVREGHPGATFPNQMESANFCLKWGNGGPAVSRERAIAFLQTVEAYWAVMHSQLGFDQRRGFTREKRDTHKMNIYLTGTGLQQPGQGNYLGNDPEGIHFISSPLHLPCMAHELGHLAEMGTYGFVDHHQVGWFWECCSNWMQWYFHPRDAPGITGWLNAHQQPLDHFDRRYDTWPFCAYLQERFGHSFVGHMWNEAQQNEPPFEVIQRLHPEVPLPDVLADFVSRCAAWDFGPSLGPLLRSLAGDQNGWQRFAAVHRRSDSRWTSSSTNLCWLGFEVINLRPMLDNGGGHPQTLTIDLQASPFPQDWRAVVVLVEADGRCMRGPSGWASGACHAPCSPTQRQQMLVVCPGRRHDDSTSRPIFSFSTQVTPGHDKCGGTIRRADLLAY